MSNKSTYGFIALAVIMILLTAFRVDQKLSGTSVTVARINKEASRFVSDMNEARDDFDDFTIERNVDEWRLRDPVVADISTGPVQRTINILITGFMKSTDKNRTIMATMDGGAVLRKGDVYKGFQVLRVTDKGVSFNINGKMEFVPIGEPFEAVLLAQVDTQLILDDIVSEDGKFVAVIGRETYKAGDWVDGGTQVKAVTPTMVMIEITVGANRKTRILEVGDELYENNQ